MNESLALNGGQKGGRGYKRKDEERGQASRSLFFEYGGGWSSLVYVSHTPSCPSPPQTQRPCACTRPDPPATATSHHLVRASSYSPETKPCLEEIVSD